MIGLQDKKKHVNSNTVSLIHEIFTMYDECLFGQIEADV